jgi:methyl-accepting chemotaxis protein
MESEPCLTLTINIRLIGTVVLSALLAIAMAALGIRALGAVQERTATMLKFDAVVAEHAGAARAGVLGLRRFEKDMFLNIGNEQYVGEYRRKFQVQLALLGQDLEILESLELPTDDERRLPGMKQEAAVYAAAMSTIIDAVSAGSITTAQAANEALTPVKGSIRALEGTAEQWAQDA